MSHLRPVSLVAQFDQLVQQRGVLTDGIEAEFLQFVLHQDNNRKRWREASLSLEQYKATLSELEAEKTALQTKLKHARSQIDYEIRKRQKVEQERDSRQKQIDLVRDLLSDNQGALNDKDREKLAFLGSDFSQYSQCGDTSTSPKRPLDPISEVSASQLSDISFDKTDDDLETSFLRCGKRWKRSTSMQPQPQQTISEEIETSPSVKRSKSGKNKKTHRRSNSADAAITGLDKSDVLSSVPYERQRCFTMSAARDCGDTAFISNCDVAVPSTTESFIGGLRRYGSGSTLTKTHVFTSQTCVRPVSCLACGKKLKFGKAMFKCKDCRASSHSECRDLVPLPCIPVAVTPGGPKHMSLTGTIADYAPIDPPMIPAIVIHCVKEIEQRGMSEVGIYRISGNEKEVRELKEKFSRGKCPNLSLIDDIHVISSCLKDFLRGLKEPLVTYKLWKNFVNAAEKKDRFESTADTYQAISELPQPNRDTIAYLVLHLQRVAECTDCKMPAANLAKVFGPTIIGYSSAEPEPMQMFAETTKQHLVIERFLTISTDYWSAFLNIDADGARDFGTPRLSEVPRNLLGPLNEIETPSSQKPRWFTPSSISRRPTQSAKKGNYFTSPMLK